MEPKPLMDSTPPNHPTYNVQLSHSNICQIVASTLPGTKVLSIQQLERGKSFNNRIYFIKLSPSRSDPSLLIGEVVLKLSGRFFGPEKVQNEVACLYLLEKHCPSVPTPRVLAWADHATDNSNIHIIARSESGELKALKEVVTTQLAPFAEEGFHAKPQHGWIVLTRSPGRQLEPSDLEGGTGKRIMEEVASHMAQMRQKMPIPDSIGNLRLRDLSSSSENLKQGDHHLGGEPGIEVNGLLNCQRLRYKAIHSALDYYHFRLEDQLMKLETEDVFALNRFEVSPLVRYFMANSLSAVQFLRQNVHGRPTFTQYDFSPRNVLVSGSPPRFTALVDFEFAGFFPPEEEFTIAAVCNEGDWPEQAYEIFLSELEILGVETPLVGIPAKRWKEVRLLMRLIEDIAPWFLRDGGIEEKELIKELRKAADNIHTYIRDLQS